MEDLMARLWPFVYRGVDHRLNTTMGLQCCLWYPEKENNRKKIKEEKTGLDKS